MEEKCSQATPTGTGQCIGLTYKINKQIESRLEASGSGRGTKKGKAKQTTLTHFSVPVLKRTSCSFLIKDLQISKTEVSPDLNSPSASSSTRKGKMSNLLLLLFVLKTKKKMEVLKKAQQELLHRSSM